MTTPESEIVELMLRLKREFPLGYIERDALLWCLYGGTRPEGQRRFRGQMPLRVRVGWHFCGDTCELLDVLWLCFHERGAAPVGLYLAAGLAAFERECRCKFVNL